MAASHRKQPVQFLARRLPPVIAELERLDVAVRHLGTVAASRRVGEVVLEQNGEPALVAVWIVGNPIEQALVRVQRIDFPGPGVVDGDRDAGPEGVWLSVMGSVRKV